MYGMYVLVIIAVRLSWIFTHILQALALGQPYDVVQYNTILQIIINDQCRTQAIMNYCIFTE